MNKNEKFVITINRELGSGGHTVGRKLAEKLDVEFYNKTLIKELQKKFNLSVEEIERLKGRKHGWWADFKRNMGESLLYTTMEDTFMYPDMASTVLYSNYHKLHEEDYPNLIDTDEVFQAETEILKGIAEDESCIIAGRSGFYVFRDHPNHLSILIQASLPHRIDRVMRKQNISEEEARKIIEKVDKMRENYVNRYTHSSRYDTRNYDLVISADGKTEDEMVNIIVKYIG